MMNIRNLGLKEKVGVKYRDSMCAKFGLKLWFESDWYFCNITKSERFKCDSETKFQTITL